MGEMDIKFLVDHNAGKLVKLLRLMGYDTLFFNGEDDGEMIAAALAEGRIVLTRDTQIMKRWVITSGRLKAVLIESDDSEQQICQVIKTLGLDSKSKPFTLCLECNKPLIERTKEEVKELVPPHVFKTQEQYMQCPNCQRIYWRGTHWQRMTEKLEKLRQTCHK